MVQLACYGHALCCVLWSLFLVLPFLGGPVLVCLLCSMWYAQGAMKEDLISMSKYRTSAYFMICFNIIPLLMAPGFYIQDKNRGEALDKEDGDSSSTLTTLYFVISPLCCCAFYGLGLFGLHTMEKPSAIQKPLIGAPTVVKPVQVQVQEQPSYDQPPLVPPGTGIKPIQSFKEQPSPGQEPQAFHGVALPGKYTVAVLAAMNLPNTDAMDKSDPYCKVSMGSTELFRTPSKRNKLNPTWGTMRVIDWDGMNDLMFSIYDKDFFTKDDFMAQYQLPKEKIVQSIQGQFPLTVAPQFASKVPPGFQPVIVLSVVPGDQLGCCGECSIQ